MIRPPQGSAESHHVLPSSSHSNSLPVAPQIPASGTRGRHCLVIRHGERIDFTFNKGQENWVTKSFDQHGRYRRFNINMPRTVPVRHGSPATFVMDTPLTEMGYLQAKLTGRALKDAGVRPTHIYVSPALRCVQTSVGLLKGMNNTALKLQVEPGLFEWGGWFRPKLPTWMSPEELVTAGYPINVQYKPFFPEFSTSESIDDYYYRSFNTLKKVLDKHPEPDCMILLVAHGASLDTCTRQITGGEPRTQHDFYQILHQTPYLACTHIQENQEESRAKWKTVDPPILPFCHQANSNYDWRCTLHDKA